MNPIKNLFINFALFIVTIGAIIGVIVLINSGLFSSFSYGTNATLIRLAIALAFVGPGLMTVYKKAKSKLGK